MDVHGLLFNQPRMVSLTPGRGAFYAIAFNDGDRTPLSGDNSYKVTAAA